MDESHDVSDEEVKRIPKEWRETACPLFIMAFIIRGEEIKDIIKEESSRCIGPECQMYSSGSRACGLRFR